MSDKMALSLYTLPVELVYRILDNLKENSILLSLRNVCKRLNTIIDTYHRYQTLTTLNLRGRKIGAEGAQHLAQALQNNTTLTALDLGDNEIGVKGAQYLAQALQNNTTLTLLNLSWNRIGVEGAQHLAQALKRNMTLTALDLRYNEIHNEVGEHLFNDVNRLLKRVDY